MTMMMMMMMYDLL